MIHILDAKTASLAPAQPGVGEEKNQLRMDRAVCKYADLCVSCLLYTSDAADE